MKLFFLSLSLLVSLMIVHLIMIRLYNHGVIFGLMSEEVSKGIKYSIQVNEKSYNSIGQIVRDIKI